MTDATAPSAAEDLLTDWVARDSRTETVFELGPVRVTTASVVYEDDRLRSVVRERTGVDSTWRFFFASRVTVPGGDSSSVLRRLVVDRVRRGFRDRLGERGFEAIEERGRRELRVGDADADLFQYDARCRESGVVVDVDGLLAVWGEPGGYLLAGGAYPTRVLETPEPETASEFVDLFDPERFREQLTALIRSVA